MTFKQYVASKLNRPAITAEIRDGWYEESGVKLSVAETRYHLEIIQMTDGSIRESEIADMPHWCAAR